MAFYSKEVNLEILNKGIDNLQTCFGGYCTNGIIDTQSLLRKIEKVVRELGISNLELTISAAGCPNSCGIAHLLLFLNTGMRLNLYFLWEEE
jgi:dissimilatory sulfite reductase (desulfoviridin) alpha/beta subunit